MILIFTYFQHKPRQKFNRSFFNLIFHVQKINLISGGFVITIPKGTKWQQNCRECLTDFWFLVWGGTCITHRSLYYTEVFIKSIEMLTNSNDWIQTFALGHFAASVKIWKHFACFVNPLVPSNIQLKVVHKHFTFHSVLCREIISF